MTFVHPHIFHNIKRHWILRVERSKVKHIVDTFFGYVLEKSFRRATVRVNEGEAIAILNILDSHVLKESGLTHAGLAYDIDMLGTIIGFDTELIAIMS